MPQVVDFEKNLIGFFILQSKKMLIAYSQTHPKYVYDIPTSSFQALAMGDCRYQRAFFMLNRSEYNGCT
jgi:hypothetical protein